MRKEDGLPLLHSSLDLQTSPYLGPRNADSFRTDLHPEFRTLAALRDALLPKLLSGELRVPINNNQTTRHL